MTSPSLIAVRGTKGISMYEGSNTQWGASEKLNPDPSKTIKCMAFSPDGNSLAWSNGEVVHVARWTNGKFVGAPFGSLPHARVSFLAFSPQGSVLATWEIFATKPGQAPQPNLQLWAASDDGRCLASLVQKKNAFWCPQWSKDEKIAVLKSQNNELNFYENNDFSKVAARLSIAKLDTFSVSPTARGPNYPVVTFVPGQKGGPGFGKLFCYPNFNPDKDHLASKSFMQADRMEVEWSYDGRMCLLLSQADVDKTGASYYGKQQLHFMSATGTTAMVQLPKNGPIYHITWSPSQAEFCVVYGFMPAKATIFNAKCEKVFDFGTGGRNMALYNPQGTILMLAGFGNLRGNVEMWSPKEKKQLAKFEAADATHVTWSPDGTRILTSTCAPRLRMGNGYKVWHYTSSLLCEEYTDSAADELWEVQWQKRPSETETVFPLQYKPVQGIAPKQPVASKVAYRPPGARNKTPGLAALAGQLHDDEPAENLKKPDSAPGTASSAEPLSKAALKNKKRKEAAKKKAAEQQNQTAQAAAVPTPAAPAVSAAQSDQIKKMRKLQDKLNAIQKLKTAQKEGKKLELNQLEKLKKEDELLAEMKKLEM